jgi:hypothetical protein
MLEQREKYRVILFLKVLFDLSCLILLVFFWPLSRLFSKGKSAGKMTVMRLYQQVCRGIAKGKVTAEFFRGAMAEAAGAGVGAAPAGNRERVLTVDEVSAHDDGACGTRGTGGIDRRGLPGQRAL